MCDGDLVAGARKDAAGEVEGQRRLADAARAVDQDAAGQAARIEPRRKRFERGGVADDRAAGTRAAARRRAGRARALDRWRSRGLRDLKLGIAAGQRVPDFLLERVFALVGREHDAAVADCCAAMSRKASRRRRCQSRSSFSKRSPVCWQRRLELAVVDAAEGDGWVHVEDEGQIGLVAIQRQRLRGRGSACRRRRR